MDFDRKVLVQEAIDAIIHQLQASNKLTVAVEEIENFLGAELEKDEINFIKNELANKGINIDEFIEAESGEKGLALTMPQEL